MYYYLIYQDSINSVITRRGIRSRTFTLLFLLLFLVFLLFFALLLLNFRLSLFFSFLKNIVCRKEAGKCSWQHSHFSPMLQLLRGSQYLLKAWVSVGGGLEFPLSAPLPHKRNVPYKFHVSRSYRLGCAFIVR